MLSGVIFDLDGVLADSHPIHLRAWKRLLSAVGGQVSDSGLSVLFDGRKREDILRHFFPDLPPAEIVSLGRWKDELFYEVAGELRPLPGVLGFLHALEEAGIPKAVASSGTRERVEFTLAKLDMRHRFKTVVAAEDIAVGKPDPAVYRLAAERLGLHCRGLVVAEDAVSGVIAAKAAGMTCLALASCGRHQVLVEAGADLVVTTFLPDLLVRLQALLASQEHTDDCMPVPAAA